MWPTSTGIRTLRGAEAALFSAAIVVMLDSLDERLSDDDEHQEDEEHYSPTADMQLGIAVFDSLTIPQRVAMLHHVSKHLLTESTPSSNETSAVDDATVAAIFAEIQDQVVIEIDLHLEQPSLAEGDESYFGGYVRLDADHWRKLVLAAFNHLYPDNDEDDFSGPANAEDTTLDTWEAVIDLLASAILWDRDFELVDGFLDEDPVSARHRKRLLGIHEDYFTEPPLDPTASQTRILLAQAKSIATRRPR